MNKNTCSSESIFRRKKPDRIFDLPVSLSNAFILAGNSTRALVRRSLDEGGAPAGILYIDSHQIAVTQGIVTTVSFYVDRTCAKATLEFGAFDLLDRNTDTNEAQLILTHRSGALTLPSAKELKPYMNLITIQLCDKDAITDCQWWSMQRY